MQTQLIPSDQYHGYFDAFDPVKKRFLYKPVIFKTSNRFEEINGYIPPVRERSREPYVDPNALPIEAVVQRILGSKSNYQSKERLMKMEELLRAANEKPVPRWLKGWDSWRAQGGLGWSMGPQQMHRHVQRTFDYLRKSGMLLFRSEFERTEDPKKYRTLGVICEDGQKTGRLDRLFGAEYLRARLARKKCDNYKVPRFVVVIEDNITELQVHLRSLAPFLGISSINTKDGEVLVQKVDGVPDARNCRHQWLTTLGYVDYSDPGNILKCRDGNYYIVDTEWKSLEGCRHIRKENMQLKRLRTYAEDRFEVFNPWLEKVIRIKMPKPEVVKTS